MKETVIRRPSNEEWVGAYLDMKNKLPAPEFKQFPWGRTWDPKIAMRSSLIADAFTAKNFFKQGRYSDAEFTRIKQGIVRTYRVYKQFSDDLPFILEDMVNQAKIGYTGLTGEFNFDG